MTTHKMYTKEFKQDAVRLITEQGYKQTEAARNHYSARTVPKQGVCRKGL